MFDFISESLFESIDPEIRLELAGLLRQRNDYAELIMEVNRRKIVLLTNPSPEKERDLAEYSSAVVAPMRTKMNEDTVKLLGKAVDIEQMKALLPLVIMGLSQSINFPLLLTTLGLDPDRVTEVIDMIKEYFSDNMI